ncbi:MAG: hypothetical protein ACT4OJ_04195 [Bacteroidota bacterium]
MPQKPKNIIRLLLSLILITCIGCTPEYSFEGGPPPRNDTIIPPPPPPGPRMCAACTGQDQFAENRWSFYNNDFFFCGIIDTAIVMPQRTGFTFFGPSACSSDSGAVYTVIFRNGTVLDHDLTNVSTERGSFYYYDNPGQSYLFMNISNTPFNFTIDTYSHQTRMATGTFNGAVRNKSGTGTFISSGKFKVRLL